MAAKNTPAKKARTPKDRNIPKPPPKPVPFDKEPLGTARDKELYKGINKKALREGRPGAWVQAKEKLEANKARIAAREKAEYQKQMAEYKKKLAEYKKSQSSPKPAMKAKPKATPIRGGGLIGGARLGGGGIINQQIR
jgi:hypothetical protein